jgi:hypothetical protein
MDRGWMNGELRSVLLGTGGLGVAAVAALLLTVTRGAVGADETRLRAILRLAVVTLLLQASHFAEELATGFHRRYPELLGLAPWSLRFFVSFNLFWLAVWGLSLWGLAARRRAALFPLWFLGLGCVVNGLAHPAFALRTGGYFPGLVTSPFLGALGVLLLRRLARITEIRR